MGTILQTGDFISIPWLIDLNINSTI